MGRLRATTTGALCVLATLVAVVTAHAAATAAPSATAGPVTALGQTTATVQGSIVPGGEPTEWHVEYGIGDFALSNHRRDAGSGTSAVVVSADLTGLKPGATYQYRFVAANAAGIVRSAPATFTTLAPPAATTGDASAVTSSSAVIRGTAVPNGHPTTVEVEYGTSTAYGARTAPLSVGAGGQAVGISVKLRDLAPGTTYHYRLVATSRGGTARGADRTFRTAAALAVETRPASRISQTRARLRGTINPRGLPGTWWFEYGPTTAYGFRTPVRSAGSGTKAVFVTRVVSRLRPRTLYHFRLVGRTAAGTVAGADRTFSTGRAPLVVTTAPTAVGETRAVLNGSVHPSGRTTTWWFEHGPTRRYGQRTAVRTLERGSVPVSVAEVLTGLRPGSQLHVRLVARNDAGTTRGRDVVFSTRAVLGVRTGRVLDLRPTRARVSGTVDAAAGSVVWFEYGRTRAYGRRTAARSVGAGATEVRATLPALVPGRRYHYRLVARSAEGMLVGANASFATPAYPRGADGRRLRCTISGTPGPDVLRGTPGRDVICGFGGRDRLIGRGGNDVLHGGAGDDTLLGGSGADVLLGGSGNDELLGQAGNDRLLGGSGRDALLGGSGHDRLWGGGGRDRLVGGTGRDVLAGGGGADLLYVRDGRRDTAHGGGGSDLAFADGLDRVTSARRR